MISVCSRIMNLTNNRTKSRKRATTSATKRDSDDKNAVAIVKIVPHLGCVSQDSELLDSLRGKQARRNPMQQVLGPIRRVRFTKTVLRQANIREKKGPSLEKIQVKILHQRSPYALKFEDQSHEEETERQQRCARSEAWNLAKNIHKVKEKDKTTFHSPAEEWVTSCCGMHMFSKRDLNSAELETMRTPRSPTTVMTANGEVQTREEANNKETDKATFFCPGSEWCPPAPSVKKKTQKKENCCRFRREHAHVEQERPELCRIGYRRRLSQPTVRC